MKLKLSSKILLSLLILRLFTNTYAEDISVEESDLNFESLSSTIAIVDMPENINKETAQNAVNTIWQIKDDESISGAVLKINCSGGAAGSSYFIFSELQKLAEKKPIVSFVENGALSGGYMMVAATNYIVATPTSTLGSIGVISTITKLSDIHLKDNGIEAAQTNHIITSGEYKADTNPYTQLEKRALTYQAYISNSIYEEFCKIVANSRNLDLNDHLNWANGREIPARKALEFNLIDEIGDLDTALNKVKELLNNDHRNINKKTNYKLRMIDACSEKKSDEPSKNEANLSSSFKL